MRSGEITAAVLATVHNLRFYLDFVADLRHALASGDFKDSAARIAECYAASEAANLMVEKAAALFEAGEACGAEANMAKLLASEASWKAADMCMQTHGGYAFAEEYDVERKFRETRLYRTAPISTNLILSFIAEHVLDLPRSY